MITTTPVSETAIPQPWRNVRRSRNKAKVHRATNNGPIDGSNEPLIARGVLQPVVRHRVVGREAGQSDDGHQYGMLADRRPIAQQRQRRERQQNQESSGPTDERKRYRRNVPDDKAAHHGIPGPEQRGQRQKEIRLIEQPTARAAFVAAARFRHDVIPAIAQIRSYPGLHPTATALTACLVLVGAQFGVDCDNRRYVKAGPGIAALA